MLRKIVLIICSKLFKNNFAIKNVFYYLKQGPSRTTTDLRKFQK